MRAQGAQTRFTPSHSNVGMVAPAENGRRNPRQEFQQLLRVLPKGTPSPSPGGALPPR